MASKGAIAITTRVVAMRRSERIWRGDCRFMIASNPSCRPQ
jgi:hypothetical protein